MDIDTGLSCHVLFISDDIRRFIHSREIQGMRCKYILRYNDIQSFLFILPGPGPTLQLMRR